MFICTYKDDISRRGMSVALDGEPALEREGVRLVYPNPVLLRFRDQDVWEGGVEGHVRRVLQTLHRPWRK